MYVPELRTNLLLVNTITNNDGKVLFSKNEVIISRENKTVLKGKKLSNGLFQVRLRAEVKQDSYLTENLETDTRAWHRKLGHLSYGNIKKPSKLCEDTKTNSGRFERRGIDLYSVSRSEGNNN